MNQLKITFAGKIVKRWKQPISNGSEKIYLAVTDGAAQFPKTFKFKARSLDQVAPFKVGAEVAVTAWVDGREWKKSDTETLYFTDLTIADIAEAGAVQAHADALAEASTDGGMAEELPF